MAMAMARAARWPRRSCEDKTSLRLISPRVAPGLASYTTSISVRLPRPRRVELSAVFPTHERGESNWIETSALRCDNHDGGNHSRAPMIQYRRERRFHCAAPPMLSCAVMCRMWRSYRLLRRESSSGTTHTQIKNMTRTCQRQGARPVFLINLKLSNSGGKRSLSFLPFQNGQRSPVRHPID